MRDIVVKVTPDGYYNGTPKFNVVLQKNGMFTFFGKFTANVGSEIEYNVSNPKYKTAKLVSVGGGSKAPSKPKYDTGQSILRQVAFKGVIELISAGKIDLLETEHYTNEFHNLLNK